jgi:hypothetical protein
MVRIKLSSSKKQYLKGKNIYDYTRGHMTIPKKILTRLEPYFEESFQTELIEDEEKIALLYTFVKKITQSVK